MNSREIREVFLRYFRERGHEILPSSPVIPRSDPTLLFANAGMNQFKDIFTGRRKASTPRAATVQKCIRAGGKHNDLDNVGYTTRHLTFFEMLGNFSFGDYFKEGAIEYGWDLLTSVFGLDPKRLWVTVYRDDDEAREIWRRRIGVPEERIVGLGEKDNYWTMGDVGPCGPCSEIHLDRGEEYGPESLGESDGERFFEIWNLVFMQYEQRAGGEKVPLARPSIDTGMGVERLALVLQGVDTVFETDVLRTIIARVEELTGLAYDSGPQSVPHRVIADHVRSLVFALADGGEVSNEGRGYVLRRILRRAARYARKLVESGEPLLCRLVGTVLETMDAAYPEIREREKYIEGVIRSEEERFGRTLDQGLEQFEEVVGRLGAGGQRVIPGADAFLLYDTFGFPIDLVEQMATERELEVDLEGYDREMAKQRERSRQGHPFVGAAIPGGESLDLESVPPTRFVGYESEACEAELLAAREAGEDTWQLILSDSPFYAESGGQVGDTGRITIAGDGLRLHVDATHKDSDRWIHTVRLAEGDLAALRTGAIVEARIDAARRSSIQKNHTATHLLHAALRGILGEHVHQKGSLVEPARLRFDVTHFSGISLEERQQAEELVQREIARNTAIETFETDYEDAVRRGAMALFGEKYGDRVRVVRIGDFSMELCGGTHVTRTGDIGGFAVLSEGSVSAGVRRLEAVTDESATRLYQEHARLIQKLASSLRVSNDQILERVEKLQEELKRLRSERGKAAAPTTDPGAVEHEVVGKGEAAIQLHSGLLAAGGRAAALEVYDRLKARSPRSVFVLLAREGEKLAAVVAVSPQLVKEGLSAKEIFDAGKKPISGRGGGRPEMVQGGGTRPAGADDAIRAMVGFVRGETRG